MTNNNYVYDMITKTNIPGVYAVGDMRTKELRHIVTAVADGTASVHEAENFGKGCDGKCNI